MNKIFRSIIHTSTGVELELLPREKSLSAAVHRSLNCQAISGDYTWRVVEITMMGESKDLVSGKRQVPHD